MSKKTIIVPTGYMGSGSSALTDILSEIDGYYAPNGSFEYIFMHCPDGLFDLEDKLLRSNDALRSDEAIYRFKTMMKSLYDTRFFWPGSYKDFVSKSYYQYSLSFIDSITTVSFSDSYWYFQELPNSIRMKLILLARVIFRKFCPLNTSFFKTPLLYNDINISLPKPDEYYSAAKKFLSNVFSDIGSNSQNLILDQLLLPHNLNRLQNYFDQNIKVVVVDRDPRDVFVLNKYVWAMNGNVVPFPFDVIKFVTYYKRMRESEIITNDNRILRMHFEDLIYNYDESLEKLYSFLNTSSDMHIRKKALFNPELSIRNTQTFRMKNIPQKEIEIIEHELSKYIYKFPYIATSPYSMDELF